MSCFGYTPKTKATKAQRFSYQKALHKLYHKSRRGRISSSTPEDFDAALTFAKELRDWADHNGFNSWTKERGGYWFGIEEEGRKFLSAWALKEIATTSPKIRETLCSSVEYVSALEYMHFDAFKMGYLAAKREDGGTGNVPSAAVQEKIKVALSTGLIAVDCPECGVVFGLSLTFQGRRREDGETFHCPNGHSNYYPTGMSDSERDRLRLLAALDQAEAAGRARGRRRAG